jgi:hypothetical protein
MYKVRSLLRSSAVLTLTYLVLTPSLFAAKPVITRLVPASTNAGGPKFTLTIEGTGFISGAKAKWGTTALTTTFANATKITAIVPAALIVKAGKASVTVTTSGGTSAASTFTVLPPRPIITSLVPDTAIAGGPKFTLAIKGKNFTTTSKVKWGTTALVTTYKSAILLEAAVTAKLIATKGTASVTVTTAGGTSAAAKFTISPPKPIISSISPSSAIAAGPKFTLTIDGFNFAAGAVAKWNTTALVTTYKSVSLITAAVPAALIAKKGTADITVTTTKGTSAAAIFTIKPPRPTITSLSPSSATAGGAAFTLSINGTGFVSGAVVKWGATKLASTFKSGVLLTASVPASLIASVGSASVTVTTPSGTSGAAKFTINAAKPVITSLSPNSITAGESAFTLTINGSGFVSGAKASWNSTALTTTFKSAVELTAQVPATLIATPTTASITVTTSGGASAPATFTVVSASGPMCANDGAKNANLDGVYSFQFGQIGLTTSDEPSQNLGAFTADGKGNITAGLSDSNGPYFATEEQDTFTGTYSVGSDNRGLLTLNYTGGSTAYLCFALDSFSSGVAGSGRLVSDQTNSEIDSGAFYAQGSSNIGLGTVKGSWTLGVQGMKLDSANSQELRGAAAGYAALDGNGNVTAGELDMSQDEYVSNALTNSYKPKIAVSGGSYTLADTGRGTLTLNYAGGGTGDFIFYVAGPSQILLLTSDPGAQGTNGVFAGKAYLRPTSITFDNATLDGKSVFVAQAVSETNSTEYNNRLVQAGIFDWLGKGTYTASYDQNDAGTVSLLKTVASSDYSVDSVGRVTISGTSPSTFAYLAGPNEGFAVAGNLGVTFTYFQSQTVPNAGFSASSFDGAYSQGSLWYTYQQQKVDSGEVLSNGAGLLSGNLDVAPVLGGVVDAAPLRPGVPGPDLRRPIPLDVGVDETYTPVSTGRFIVDNGTVPSKVLYIVSPDKAYAIDISGAAWLPLEEFNHQ